MYSRRFVALAIVVVFAGCAPLPRHERSLQPVSINSLGSAKTLGAQDRVSQPTPESAWSFGDPQLARLIALGLTDSAQYAQVVVRVRKADALVGQQRATTAPQIAADGSVSEAVGSRNIGVPSFFIPKGLHSNSRLTLGATLDADLFGRQRAAIAAAVSEAAATRFDLDAARLSLITAIAGAYVDYAQTCDDEAAAEAVAKLRARQLSLSNLRFKAGLDDQSVAIRATSDARVAQQAIVDAKAQILIARYRLAALVGAGPDFGATLEAPMLTVPHDAIDQLGLDVIANRPDVAAAKLRVAAQADRVKAARRDFYPNISLSALAGFQSYDLNQLLLGGSAIPSFGAALHLPIFSGGRLKAAYRAQQADHDAAVLMYNGALVGALQDVGTTVTRLHLAEARATTAVANLRDAERNDMIMQARLHAKLVSDFGTLPVRNLLLDAQARVADTQNALIQSRIEVMRALGGRLVQERSGELK